MWREAGLVVVVDDAYIESYDCLYMKGIFFVNFTFFFGRTRKQSCDKDTFVPELCTDITSSIITFCTK